MAINDDTGNEIGDDFSQVLLREIAILRPQTHDPKQSAQECAGQAQLVGLALSGGGIRSATFNLGVIQALARLRLLRAFDYLSTVSGGGYIGAWLSSLIWRMRRPGQSAALAVATVEDALSAETRPWCSPNTVAADCPPEHPSVSFLRRYSNYLTPRLGLFSGDSLAAIATYLRNFLLNLLILTAFFGLLLCLPHLMLHLSRWLIDPNGFSVLTASIGETRLPWIYGLAIVFLAIALFACALSLMQFPRRDRFQSTGTLFVVAWIVVPALISAWLLAVAFLVPIDNRNYTLWDWVQVAALSYFVPWLFVFWLKTGGSNIAWVMAKKLTVALAALFDPVRFPAALQDIIDWMLALLRFCWQIPWTLLAGGLGGAACYALAQQASKLPASGDIEYAICFATPLALLIYSTVLFLHVGLMKRLYSEYDREWWARLGGLLLLATLLWLGGFAVALYGAATIDWLAGLALAGGLGWMAISIGGVLLGKSAFTGAGAKTWLECLITAAPYVFIVGLLVILADALHTVLADPRGLCDLCEPIVATADFQSIVAATTRNLDRTRITDVLWVSGACATIFGVLGWRVDINLFSLYGFYRNRLTRCYLGATRLGPTLPLQVQREAHPFTGFDPKDDLPLSSLADQRPYPIVNAAMNLTGGEDLAWQTRRAGAFAFTPCHTGFEFWKSDGTRVGAYRSTEDYSANQFTFENLPGGILLGSVVAVSGAAANPNMGYHTSAPLSALLGLFCVRLGRWCGNPLHPTAWRKASPRFGGVALLKEVFGLLTINAAFLNISDGGHFENLGIYELVRRRCRIVVAVDAGCDPDLHFEDLANAIRKCQTDFGVSIEIDLSSIRRNADSKLSPSHFAVGCIRYPDAPQPGVLIYIKSSLSGDESSDVREYADRHRDFPHQSTKDQFFDEDQFESYRVLGRHIGLKVFAPLFAPLLDSAATQMTPEQIRDALLERLPDHPALAPQRNAN